LKTLIIGHRGLVGSALVRTVPQHIEAVTLERENTLITDYREMSLLLKRVKPDAVVLAAARVGGIGANSKYQKKFLIENLNIQNSVIMSSLDAGVAKFIFLGSSCIYPKFALQPINEDSILTGSLEPTNEGYALAKLAGIRLVRAIHEEDGLNFFSLMPTNLYGPNDNFDEFSSHVPAALMRKFHEAKNSGAEEVSVWGTGTPRREFMHVDDMANCCWYMLGQEAGGELINVGTGEDLKISELAELIAKIVGYRGNIVYDASKPDGTPRKLLDVSKIHSYGWKHGIELDQGLQQTYAWFIEALERGEVRGY